MKKNVIYSLLLAVAVAFAIFLVIDWREHENGLSYAVEPAYTNYESSENYISDEQITDVAEYLTRESPAKFGVRLHTVKRMDEKSFYVTTNKIEGIIEAKDTSKGDLTWRVLDQTSNKPIMESENWDGN